MLRLAMVFLVTSLLFVFNLSAKEAGQCHRQLKDLCKDKPSGKEKFECMKENISKMSPDCQAMMQQRQEHKMDRVCFEDHMKFCKDIKGGEGRIHNCLKAKLNELSPACKEKMEKKGQKEIEVKKDAEVEKTN